MESTTVDKELQKRLDQSADIIRAMVARQREPSSMEHPVGTAQVVQSDDGNLADVGYRFDPETVLSIAAQDDKREGFDDIHLVAKYNDTVRLRMLHQHSTFDVNKQSISGLTALHLAAKYGHTQIVGELLGYQTAVDPLDGQGCTPLHYAAQGGYGDIALNLLEAGANARAESKTKKTALHRAAHQGHVHLIGILLDKGADKDAQTTEGWTALMFAAYQGSEAAVSILLSRGALSKITAHGGLTALQIAQVKRHYPVIELLSSNRGKYANAQAASGHNSIPASPRLETSPGHTPELSLGLRVSYGAGSNQSSRAPSVTPSPRNSSNAEDGAFLRGEAAGKQPLEMRISLRSSMGEPGLAPLRSPRSAQSSPRTRTVLGTRSPRSEKNSPRSHRSPRSAQESPRSTEGSPRKVTPQPGESAEGLQLPEATDNTVMRKAKQQVEAGSSGSPLLRRAVDKRENRKSESPETTEKKRNRPRSGSFSPVSALSASGDGNPQSQDEVQRPRSATASKSGGFIDPAFQQQLRRSLDASKPMTEYEKAIAEGLDAVKSHLQQKGAKKVRALDSAGRSLLHYALIAKKIDIVSHLLECGASPDASTADGLTPLMLAAQGQFYPGLTALLEKGASTKDLSWLDHFPRPSEVAFIRMLLTKMQ